MSKRSREGVSYTSKKIYNRMTYFDNNNVHNLLIV